MTSEQVRTLVLFALVLGGLYFLMIRPTRRRAQEVNALQKALVVGADVMLTSGIFGTVRAIDDEKIDVEVADGVVMTVHRGAIGKVLTPPAADDAEPSDLDAADEVGNDPDGSDVHPPSTGTDADTPTEPDDDSRGAH